MGDLQGYLVADMTRASSNGLPTRNTLACTKPRERVGARVRGDYHSYGGWPDESFVQNGVVSIRGNEAGSSAERSGFAHDGAVHRALTRLHRGGRTSFRLRDLS